MTRPSPEEETDLQPAEDNDPLWGIEVEFFDRQAKSVFFTTRKVILDGDYVQIQLPDGKYVSYPPGKVRKVLAVRAKGQARYTDGDSEQDEFY